MRKNEQMNAYDEDSVRKQDQRMTTRAMNGESAGVVGAMSGTGSLQNVLKKKEREIERVGVVCVCVCACVRA